MAEMPVWMNSLRVVARRGVHRQAVDVASAVGNDLRAAVDGLPMPSKTRPSMSSTRRVRCGWPRKAQRESERLMPVEASNSCTTALVAVDFQHLAAALAPFGRCDFRQLVIRDALTPSTSIRGPRPLIGSYFFEHQPSSSFSISDRGDCCSGRDQIARRRPFRSADVLGAADLLADGQANERRRGSRPRRSAGIALVVNCRISRSMRCFAKLV